MPVDEVASLGQSILDLRDQIGFCERCFNLADQSLCPICSDGARDTSLICVVEEATNLMAIERTGAYRGLYHVLGGALSPLKDVGPDDLSIRELILRLQAESVQELILATNPNVEGEATAVYIARLLANNEISISRLAQGLPAGGELEYTDDLTLRRALEDRRNF
jgi:recombination protein RecR